MPGKFAVAMSFGEFEGAFAAMAGSRLAVATITVLPGKQVRPARHTNRALAVEEERALRTDLHGHEHNGRI